MGSVISCFGLRLGVRTNAAGIWPRIVERMPVGSAPLPDRTAPCVYSFWVGPPPPRHGVRPMNLLYRNSACISRSPELDALFARFEGDLQATAALRSPDSTFLRADGVRIGSRAMLVTHTDGGGEDPLVEDLIRRGAVLFAQKFAPLDRHGRLEPCVSRRSIPQSGPDARTGSLPIGVVVLAARGGDGLPRLERLSRAVATVELVSLAATAAGAPASRLEILITLARRADVVRLVYSDPPPAAAELLCLLAQREPEP